MSTERDDAERDRLIDAGFDDRMSALIGVRLVGADGSVDPHPADAEVSDEDARAILSEQMTEAAESGNTEYLEQLRAVAADDDRFAAFKAHLAKMADDPDAD